MRREPRPRKDGVCARPGCDRQRPTAKTRRRQRTPHTNYAAVDHDLLRLYLEEDPFCSTQCCRLFHGTEKAA